MRRAPQPGPRLLRRRGARAAPRSAPPASAGAARDWRRAPRRLTAACGAGDFTRAGFPPVPRRGAGRADHARAPVRPRPPCALSRCGAAGAWVCARAGAPVGMAGCSIHGRLFRRCVRPCGCRARAGRACRSAWASSTTCTSRPTSCPSRPCLSRATRARASGFGSTTTTACTWSATSPCASACARRAVPSHPSPTRSAQVCLRPLLHARVWARPRPPRSAPRGILTTATSTPAACACSMSGPDAALHTAVWPPPHTLVQVGQVRLPAAALRQGPRPRRTPVCSRGSLAFRAKRSPQRQLRALLLDNMAVGMAMRWRCRRSFRVCPGGSTSAAARFICAIP